MRRIESILVALDFTGGSNAAVEIAEMLARDTKAEVELLHVWERAERLLPPIVLDVEGPDSMDRFEREVAAHGLPAERAATFLLELAKRGLKFRARFETGTPAPTICRVADEEGHDLIVMGTHGRRGVARVVLGSVAEAVVRQSKVPVLTVRGDERTNA